MESINWATHKITNKNNIFNTPDMTLAATLLCYGYVLDSIDKNNPKKCLFNVKKDKELDSLVEKFWNGQLEVEPIKFWNTIKSIKSRLYNY